MANKPERKSATIVPTVTGTLMCRQILTADYQTDAQFKEVILYTLRSMANVLAEQLVERQEFPSQVALTCYSMKNRSSEFMIEVAVATSDLEAITEFFRSLDVLRLMNRQAVQQYYFSIICNALTQEIQRYNYKTKMREIPNFDGTMDEVVVNKAPLKKQGPRDWKIVEHGKYRPNTK